MTDALIDPPPPPHARPPRPFELTPAIQARVIAVDRDPKTYPLGSAWEEDVGGTRYWFRIVQHTHQGATGRTGLFHAAEVWVLEPDAPLHPTHLAATPFPSAALGIDVSDYQRGADFRKIAAVGYAFVWIKATEGATGPNSTQLYAGQHFAGAGAAGLLRGFYHFFRTTSDPVAQIAHFAEVTGALGAPELPPMLDVEWQHPHPNELGGITPGDFLARVAVAVRELARVTGRRPVLYTAPGFWALLIAAHPDLADEVDFWEADYGPSAPALAGLPAWKVWQFTANGTVPGCPGLADCNRFAGTADALRAWALGEALPPNPDGGRILEIAEGVDQGKEGLD